MNDLLRFELTDKSLELRAGDIVDEVGEREFSGRSVENADSKDGLRGRFGQLFLYRQRGPTRSGNRRLGADSDAKAHLDCDAVIRHVVRQHGPVDNSPRSQDALQLSTNNLLPSARFCLALATGGFCIFVADFGSERSLGLVDAADFVSLGEELTRGSIREYPDKLDPEQSTKKVLTLAAQKSKLDSGTPTIAILTRSVSLRSKTLWPIRCEVESIKRLMHVVAMHSARACSQRRLRTDPT